MKNELLKIISEHTFCSSVCEDCEIPIRSGFIRCEKCAKEKVKEIKHTNIKEYIFGRHPDEIAKMQGIKKLK